MKKIGIYIWLCLCGMLHTACTKDATLSSFYEEQGTVIEFTHENFERVQIGTRGLAELQAEWRIDNMYVCIFEADPNSALYGKRLYSHTFLQPDLVATENAVRTAGLNECWFVDNKSADDDLPSHGCMNLKIPTMSKANIYLISNVHLLDLSPELLDVQTSSEENIHNLFVSSSSTSLYRTGLIMTGQTKEVKTVGNKIQTASGQPVKVMLERIDARIEVNVQIDPERTADDKRPFLRAFHPVKWELVNMPKNMRLMNDNIADKQNQITQYEYFNVPPTNFEIATDLPLQNIFGEKVVQHSFGFYMLENLQPEPKNHCNTFNDRDRRTKNSKGEHIGVEGDIWVNAPERSTYMRIMGQLEMVQRNIEGGDSKSRQLFADVVYYIHLGCGNQLDASGKPVSGTSDYDDFSIRRNTSYTYNITIKGVDNIMVEVESSKSGKPEDVEENEPAATGDTFEALESYHKFDAHYAQRAFRFRAKHMMPNPEFGNKIKLTWYVETPFSSGSPLQIGAGGLDYKWVKFLRNRVVTGADFNEHYSHKNRYYPGDRFNEEHPALLEEDRMMDVEEFTNYLIHQAEIYWSNKQPGAAQRPHDFKPEIIDGKEEDCIWFTLFIDEYYYDKHPISGAAIDWATFVNGRDRMMHLLCDNTRSLDKASSVTQSVTTIRQRPIQTPYDLASSQKLNVWGVETINEPVIVKPSTKSQIIGGETVTIDDVEYYPTWFYSEDDAASGKTHNGAGVLTEYNGRLNTLKLIRSNTEKNWSSYFNIDKHGSNEQKDWELPENDLPFLKNGKRTLLNSVLMRNRDANANDLIDDDEIKWYIGSVDQLNVFYMGDTGVAGEAKFYPANMINEFDNGNWPSPPTWTNIGSSSFKGSPKWRSHIVTSTVTSNANGPELMWAEEGLSVSRYGAFEWNQTPLRGAYAIRCLRNIGQTTDLIDKVVIVKKQGNDYYFDLRRLNRESLRHRGERVDPNINILDPSNEWGENSFLPLGLQTGVFIPNSEIKTKINYTKEIAGEGNMRNFVRAIHAALQRDMKICPEGYRVLNVREAGLLLAYCSSDWWKDSSTFVSTFWSLEQKAPADGTNGTKVSWRVGNEAGNKLFTQSIDGTHGIRCVKDLDPHKFDWTDASH